MRGDDRERDLPQEGGLASHVGSREQHASGRGVGVVARAAQDDVVADEGGRRDQRVPAPGQRQPVGAGAVPRIVQEHGPLSKQNTMSIKLPRRK